MRQLAVATLIAATLCACSPSTPEPMASAKAPVASTPEAPAKPVQNTTPAKEIPEGECGDQSKLPADQRVANTARWTTASEQDSFGFEVFRGDSEKGEFTKLTKEPVLGAGTSDETHKYEYRDDTIDPCREYWYYVEGITTGGAHEKFTPTFRAPPKRRAVGSAPTAAPASTVPPAPAPAKS